MRFSRIRSVSEAVATALVLVLLLIPGLSEACSVCMGGREDETRMAFEWMTLFMTVTPLALVGSVLWWLRRRFRELEALHSEVRGESVVDGATATSEGWASVSRGS
jgi:hypothetical protein